MAGIVPSPMWPGSSWHKPAWPDHGIRDGKRLPGRLLLKDGAEPQQFVFHEEGHNMAPQRFEVLVQLLGRRQHCSWSCNGVADTPGNSGIQGLEAHRPQQMKCRTSRVPKARI